MVVVVLSPKVHGVDGDEERRKASQAVVDVWPQSSLSSRTAGSVGFRWISVLKSNQ